MRQRWRCRSSPKFLRETDACSRRFSSSELVRPRRTGSPTRVALGVGAGRGSLLHRDHDHRSKERAAAPHDDVLRALGRPNLRRVPLRAGLPVVPQPVDEPGVHGANGRRRSLDVGEAGYQHRGTRDGGEWPGCLPANHEGQLRPRRPAGRVRALEGHPSGRIPLLAGAGARTVETTVAVGRPADRCRAGSRVSGRRASEAAASTQADRLTPGARRLLRWPAAPGNGWPMSSRPVTRTNEMLPGE
jgi:hypothetical protein